MKYSYTKKQIVMRPYGANYLQGIQQLGVVYRFPNITKQNNEKIHNAISELSK